jgi:hypothetical protein
VGSRNLKLHLHKEDEKEKGMGTWGGKNILLSGIAREH